MSWQATTHVTEHSRHKGGNLLCLLMIANYAGADGRDSWPSVEKLAKDCRMSERQIQRIIVILEESGELLVERGAGPRGTHKFQVVMNLDGRQDVTPAESAPRRRRTGDKMTPRQNVWGDKSGAEGVTFPPPRGDITVSPKQENGPKNNPSFSGDKPQKEKRPASLEEVIRVGAELGFPSEACTDFWDLYEGNGWRLGGVTPIQDWQAVLRRHGRKWVANHPVSNSDPKDHDEPKEGTDWVLHCPPGGAGAFKADPKTKEPFDAIAWFRARPNLTPNRKWRAYMDQQERAA